MFQVSGKVVAKRERIPIADSRRDISIASAVLFVGFVRSH